MTRDPESEKVSIKVTVNFKVKLLTRYEQAVDELISKISNNEDYIVEPVLLAKDVDSSVLEKIPSCVHGHRIRCVVVSRQLYITSLSIGNPHAGGVGAINHLARTWNVDNWFDIYSNGVTMFGKKVAAAPDMAITIPAKFARRGEMRRTVGTNFSALTQRLLG